jgi:PAS domain S-box-containing protein
MNTCDHGRLDAFRDRYEPPAADRPVVIKFSPLPPHAPLFVSDNITEQFGYVPGDVIGNANFLKDFLLPDDLAPFISCLFHLFLRGHHLYDYRMLRKDRTVVRKLVDVRLHRDPSGAPVSITGICAEPSVLIGRCGADVFASSVQESGSDVIELLVDCMGRIREVSREVRDVLGYRPHQLVGTSILRVVPVDYHLFLRQALTRMLDGGMDTLFFWTAANHQNGTIRFLANECRGFNDLHGERNFTARCHDITGRVTAAQARLSSFRDGTVPLPGAFGDPYSALTAREQEVLHLVVEGHSSTEIGTRLSISPRTVEAHRSNLMKKLRVTSIPQLVRYACSRTSLALSK